MIVDDEPMARKVLEEYIGDVDFLELSGKAENPVKAAVLLRNNPVDLLFLDINMPQMSGIDFLRNSPGLPMTVLTTAYTEYALEGFELDVIDYLVKPFSAERFLKACTKAKEFYSLQHRESDAQYDYFFVKCEGKIEKVHYHELFYIEAMQNYVVLHLEERKLVVYLTIKGLHEQLPARTFLKVHKSTIVNIEKIRNIEGYQLDMGKAKVTISQSSYEGVMQEILKGRILKR
jgi:DNA-binding LytR/AlgR family response regulator